MAKAGKVASLSAKLGSKGRGAFDGSKGNETKFDSGGGLPDGIENGIAQLADIKFGTYEKGDNKGEFFFRASAVVIAPKVYNGIPIEGLRTNIGPEPLCETPGKSRETLDQHLDWVLNELRKLGLDTSELEFEDLEGACESLVESAPTFRFRTWKGKKATEGKYKDKEPMVQHVWNGVVDYDAGDDGDGVVDETEQDEGEEEPTPPPKKSSAKVASAPAKKAAPKKAAPKKAEPTLEELGAMADGQDEDAMLKLQEMADELGIDHEAIGTWSEVAGAIDAMQNGEAEGEEEPEAEEEEGALPEKGDVVQYKEPKSKKATEWEVIFVNTKNNTVNIKSLDTDKKLANIPIDSLVS